MLRSTNKKRGAAAILLAVLIASVVLLIGMSMSSIVISELKLSRGIGESIVAIYAADSGAEKCLFNIKNDIAPCRDLNITDSGVLDNQATYQVVRTGSTSLTSLGVSRGISRKVQLSW